VVYFASDKSGFSNIYSYEFNSAIVEQITNLDSDFTTPDWVLGESTFDVLPNGKLIAQYSLKGEAVLCLVDPILKTIENLTEEFSVISDLRYVYGDTVCFIARSTIYPSTLFTCDLKTKEITIIRKSANLVIEEEFISKHQHLEYPVANSKTAHIVFYPPTNPNYKLESPPPCIVLCHGGPTARSQGGLNLQIQYWTSRGFAYACLNYGGSSGYGREYRERLNGKWGVVDVDDACRAAEW
jgi:dipeptidyl aminopeptidase/acylaminoacyl peptidase